MRDHEARAMRARQDNAKSAPYKHARETIKKTTTKNAKRESRGSKTLWRDPRAEPLASP